MSSSNPIPEDSNLLQLQLQQFMKALQQFRHNIDSTFAVYHQEIEAIKKSINQTPVTGSSIPVPTVQSPEFSQGLLLKSFKDIFNGDKASYAGWRLGIESVLDEDGHSLPTSLSKGLWIWNHLGPKARPYIDVWMEENKAAGSLSNKTLLNQLDVVFKNTQQQKEALAKLSKLYQGQRLFNSYLAEFEQTLQKAGGSVWEPRVKKDYLFRGISNSLRDRFVTVKLDHLDWISMVEEIRHVAINHEALRKGVVSSSTVPVSSPSSFQPVSIVANDPMEIDTVSSKP